jgi:hypothetical protein
MKNICYKKTIVFGTILMFFGASIVSATNINVESTNVIDEIENPIRDTKTLYPTDDTCIKQQLPNTIFGLDDNLIVRNKYGAFGEPIYEDDILIKFDLSSLYGKKINHAELKLFYFKWTENDPFASNNCVLTIHRVTSSWNENTVTWNSKPTWNKAIIIDSEPVPSTEGQWMTWDVTSELRDFVSGVKNDGWCIMDLTYWGWYDIPATFFYSKEHQTHPEIPELYVDYTNSRSVNHPNLNLLEQLSIRFPLLARLLQLPVFTKLLQL